MHTPLNVHHLKMTPERLAELVLLGLKAENPDTPITKVHVVWQEQAGRGFGANVERDDSEAQFLAAVRGINARHVAEVMDWSTGRSAGCWGRNKGQLALMYRYAITGELDKLLPEHATLLNGPLREERARQVAAHLKALELPKLARQARALAEGRTDWRNA